jgi:hypothetical protein
LLDGCEKAGFAPDAAHAVGALLAAARTSDVVDAHLVLLAAARRATVITSDAAELERLAAHQSVPIRFEKA